MFTVKQNIIFILLLLCSFCYSQNSMVGDGFGGRLWYTPTNYGVGSYSAYSLCHDETPNQLYGWGDNGTNQIGIGSIGGVNIPTQIPNMTNVKYYSCGYLTGAIKNDNSGWVWGSAFIPSSPFQVITNLKFLDAGSESINFVKNDGTVWSMGENTAGNFGDGTFTDNYISPVQMLTINNAVRVANNSNSTIVLLSDSTLMASGAFPYTGLIIGSSNTPLPILGLPKIIDIKSSNNGTIALTDSGFVYIWGPSFSPLPVKINNLTNIVAISGCDDGYHFMAIDENKNCYAWGINNGQMGFPSSVNTSIPNIVASNVIDVMAGEEFSYIVKADGSLWASGTSLAGSIWLNLPNIQRDSFAQIDPSAVLSACPIVGDNVPSSTLSDDSDTTRIILPNVFSPNGDGENDEFYFPSYGLEDLNWQVYNRWGTLVFETNQINQTWDGRTTADKECSEGTYYYILNYKFGDKEWETKKGYVTLLR